MPAAESIAVTCSHCSANFRVKPEAAGRSVKCPQCRQRTPVAEPNGHDPAMDWLGIDADELQPPSPRISLPPAMQSKVASEKPSVGRDPHIEPRRYPALRIVQYTLYGFAAIGFLQWIVVSAVTIIALFRVTSEDDGGSFFAIASLFPYTAMSLVSVCMLVASAETIRVILDVQDDTRRTALYASRLPIK